MLVIPRRATPEITIEQLEELLRDDAAHVLDVREEWEYVRGHVPGAIHVPLHALHARLDELPRDRRIAVICQSGNRSLTATDLLLAKGFGEVASVAGGTGAWARSGRSIEQGAPHV
jgi:rhodanese-related sulfurtransferase